MKMTVLAVTEEDQEVVVPSSNIPLSGSQLDHLHSLIPTNITKDERIPKYVELVRVFSRYAFRNNLEHNYCMGSKCLLSSG